ncbi:MULTISPECIES: polysaccharide biosynthesis protein [Psychrilyobacter]|uniref:NAD-dependent epimerase/dehydratase family protein n=1 Tax=Psychrilyobacter piezotolerans TaxID=2293438 RepID=A0ABX9KE29_9FUSO|nr:MULTISPECIES: nucleoside-diphosphate sugar epimerase/dehydratase [Psychrilyobacter]MCS5423182.1 polysaccharide biosynthesis protein [Psychrilyobacter sp. S5]NDI76291.1 polysaccharide biosynthesis protein [Psychrilyobacter piezotolerans]RDE59177.1 polysaccharide biosynthesis protein [Psychrilyobacter sp. S5]REI39739.1 NAD-dependent epimerase/dehydratase family protein [Psychrilyobacter piezotolerans]
MLKNAVRRNTIKILLDIILLSSAFIFSFMIRFEGEWTKYFRIRYVAHFLIIYIVLNFILKINKKSWRYTDSLDVFNIICVVVMSNMIHALGVVLFSLSKFPISMFALFIVFEISFLLIGRFTFRLRRTLESIRKNKRCIGVKKRALMIGAGEAGEGLLRESVKNPSFKLDIVGLIDDDPRKKNMILHTKRVLGNRFDLPRLIDEYDVCEVIIAIPSMRGKEIKELYKLIDVNKTAIKVLPSYDAILEGSSFINQIRDVKVEDLLGREIIEVNSRNIALGIEGKVIFITGGAGSIGSELSRQIIRYNPRKIINIDVNENAIYFLELELKRKYKNVEIISEIGNIREYEKMECLFRKYKPEIVFHAAAHKHVPLMEHNPEEAVKNNIFGTKNIIDLSDIYGAERFILVSTDKAVNPTNIMGATKRAAEILVEEKNKKSSTKFVATRFGNVLGSNGSVIPLFKKLIEEKKNITVTHPEITRYFMTIPEAASLVIEAGTMADGGEVFILDMGEPVKIMDLAKNLIKLSGLTLGEDIDIEITGLRPGEKLYEELLYDVNSAEKTENKKIFIGKLHDDEEVKNLVYLKELEEILKVHEYGKLKEIMKKLVVTFREPEEVNNMVKPSSSYVSPSKGETEVRMEEQNLVTNLG